METPSQCPQCGNDVRYIKAGVSQRTGKPYGAFYACSNKCGYTVSEDSGLKKAVPPTANRDAILLDEIKAINERLDKLTAHIVTKLGA